MRTAATSIAGSALGVILAGPALAQSNQEVQAQIPVAPTGLALQAGGGVTAFTREDARDRFGTGGYWDVRGVLGTGSYLGAELAYVGSARGANALGLDGNAALLGNGAEAVGRLNLPILRDNIRLEPFLFGGIGWTYYSIVNSDANVSEISDGANALVLPFGAGFSATFDRFVLDARFTYRPTYDDALVDMGDGGELDLQNWSVGLTLGFEL